MVKSIRDWWEKVPLVGSSSSSSSTSSPWSLTKKLVVFVGLPALAITVVLAVVGGLGYFATSSSSAPPADWAHTMVIVVDMSVGSGDTAMSDIDAFVQHTRARNATIVKYSNLACEPEDFSINNSTEYLQSIDCYQYPATQDGQYFLPNFVQYQTLNPPVLSETQVYAWPFWVGGISRFFNIPGLPPPSSTQPSFFQNCKSLEATAPANEEPPYLLLGTERDRANFQPFSDPRTNDTYGAVSCNATGGYVFHNRVRETTQQYCLDRSETVNHEFMKIHPDDIVTVENELVWSVVKARNITRFIILGSDANICVLYTRGFSLLTLLHIGIPPEDIFVVPNANPAAAGPLAPGANIWLDWSEARHVWTTALANTYGVRHVVWKPDEVDESKRACFWLGNATAYHPDLELQSSDLACV